MYKNMYELLSSVCEEYKEKIAFKVSKNKKYIDITYNQLRNDVFRFAGFLQENNYNLENISVIGENSYEWIVVYFATLCTGGTIVPLDNNLLAEEVINQLARSNSKTVFCTEKHIEAVSQTAIKCFRMDNGELWDVSKASKYYPCYIDSEKMSVLLFTSGTTSASKAVMLSQKNVIFDACSMQKWEVFYPSDISVAVLPFHHTFGMLEILLFLLYGMQNVLENSLLHLAKTMKECKATTLVAVPKIHDIIKEKIEKGIKEQGKEKSFERAQFYSKLLLKIGIDIRRKLFKDIINDLGNLRIIVCGAAAATKSTNEWFNSIGVIALSGYGLTETSACTAAENECNIRSGSVGKAIYGVEVKIDNPDENGIGELLIKGDNVMLGYYYHKEETQKAFEGKWFKSGDIGYIDEDDFIFITGRKKNVIVLSNGENVYPEEIEKMLLECTVIKECIVYAENNTDKICATIVYNNFFDETDAKTFISKHVEYTNEKLSTFKKIRGFTITDKEFEKTTTLKIKR